MKKRMRKEGKGEKGAKQKERSKKYRVAGILERGGRKFRKRGKRKDEEKPSPLPGGSWMFQMLGK
jgi:hypothetical protein